MNDALQAHRDNDATRSPLDTRGLRNTLGHFATGVTVVSYLADGEPRGLTINSFISVSMDPPLILVSIARGARAAQKLVDAPFVVNVLGAEQLQLALQFAGQPQDGLDVPWSRDGVAPRLAGSAAWLACSPYSCVEAGDHLLLLGRVVDHRGYSDEPLLFHAGKFGLVARLRENRRTAVSRPALGHAAMGGGRDDATAAIAARP